MGQFDTPTRIPSKVKSKLNACDFLKNREVGLKRTIGYNDDISLKSYCNFDKYLVSGRTSSSSHSQTGGIFNLEFSSDGRLLIAACEQRSVLLYDAGNQQKFKTIDEAHSNCVNCVRFLSDKTFATCSDDNSIKLWDIRFLKACRKTLYGHSNWVKNIEYSENENVMVTSAMDGSIYTWDLKSSTEHSLLYDKLFVLNGLMRTKLSPDSSKMIISTTSGFMIIIHDLNLMCLSNDLRAFKPDLYRLMQVSDQNFPAGTISNYLFNPSRRRNRVEFIDDFPNDAEVISSLQIHPQGWIALSRNFSSDEKEEWTCVHDIQRRDPSEYSDAFLCIEEEDNSDTEENSTQRPSDLWMGYIPYDQYNRERQIAYGAYDNIQHIQVPTMGIINSGLIGRNTYNAYFQQHPEYKNKVITNLPRLTHFIKEKNVCKGYMKEVCFSADGRIICSPYDKGIRLLGFNDSCQELTYCVPDRPKQLSTIVEMNNYHIDFVVCCKFSPVHMQLVSGSLGGDIVWYKPVL